jgi:hypothetical protein
MAEEPRTVPWLNSVPAAVVSIKDMLPAPVNPNTINSDTPLEGVKTVETPLPVIVSSTAAMLWPPSVKFYINLLYKIVIKKQRE